jgi:hypothetical protein
MPGIFISYRRDDAIAWAGRLFDRLVAAFGSGRVFMDIEGGIPRGAEFGRVLDEALRTCDVLLAVIGPRWLKLHRDGAPRIAAKDDWVRNEIRTALRRGIPVIPVLVGRGKWPEAQDVPEDIRPLLMRESAEVTDGRWNYEVGQLVSDIAKLVPSLQPAVGLEGTAAPLLVERVRDAAAQRDDLLAAIELLNSRLPEDEVYDPGELFALIKHHLRGDFGPSRSSGDWRGYSFVAKQGRDVVGTVLAYEDLAANFLFISYLAGREPDPQERGREPVVRPLLEALICAQRDAGPQERHIRAITEFDHPAATGDPGERDRRIARIKLFEAAAQATGLELRCLDVDYVQPMIDPSKQAKRMLLAYASEELGAVAPRSQIEEILEWTYTRLYSEDIFTDPADREPYRRHTRELLASVVRSLPQEVQLLKARHIALALKGGASGTSGVADST